MEVGLEYYSLYLPFWPWSGWGWWPVACAAVLDARRELWLLFTAGAGRLGHFCFPGV